MSVDYDGDAEYRVAPEDRVAHQEWLRGEAFSAEPPTTPPHHSTYVHYRPTTWMGHTAVQRIITNRPQHLTTKENPMSTNPTITDQAESDAQAYEATQHPTHGGGDVDRRAVEADDDATAVVAVYLDVANEAPVHALSLDKLAVKVAEGHRALDPTDEDDLLTAMRGVQNVLKERAVDRMTRLGEPVYIDGTPSNRGWLTDTPCVRFCALTGRDRAIRQLAGDGVKAIAVYFDPALAERQAYRDRFTGEWAMKPNQYDPAGYVAVVGVFASHQHALEARRELDQAIRTVTSSQDDTAMVDDEMRTLDAYEPPRTVIDGI